MGLLPEKRIESVSHGIERNMIPYPDSSDDVDKWNGLQLLTIE